MGKDEEKKPKGFTAEEIQKSFAEESTHKLKPTHTDRKRQRDKERLLEALRSGDRVLFHEVCDLLGAVKGTDQRAELEAIFRKKHGYV